MAFVCFFAGLVCACKSGNAGHEKFTVAFSQCTGEDLWRKNMLDEMRTELTLYPEIDFVYADALGKSEDQIAQVKSMVGKGIDLLVISPNEAEPLTATVKGVMQMGIPVIIIDRKINSRDYTAFIGADNYEIGEMAGQYLQGIAPGSTKIMEILGLSGSSPAIDRERGFSQAIKKRPDLEITKRIYGNWSEATAKDSLTFLKSELAEVGAIFAHNDNMALGARKVLNQFYPGKKIPIIGVDACLGDGGGLDMVYNKQITASLVYPTFGKEAILTALKILKGENFKKDNILSSIVIDSSNVRMMKMQAARISNQQKDITVQKKLLDEQRVVYKSQQAVLNVMVVLFVLALVLGGITFLSLTENRKINRNLERKNEEIHKQQNLLIEMSSKAAAGNEARLNFYTNITHELRTPLTLILSPVEDMANDQRLLPLAGEKITALQRNTNRLLNLVNQLLDFRKIEIDGYVIQAAEHNIISFIRDVMEPFKIYARKRDVHLTFIPEEKELLVWFDINLLDKVILNLLSNAFKFVSEGGIIKIYVAREADSVNIKIQDNGIGMYQKDIPLIFDPYYQADNAPRTGSGIGLSLVKEIIDKHKAQIEVASEKWKGSTFSIKLPLGSKHLSEKEKAVVTSPIVSYSEKALLYQNDIETVVQDVRHQVKLRLKEYSLLVVEDNNDLLNYLVKELSDEFDVFFAKNGRDAIELAQERVPDLIVTDNVIPEVSGKDVCRILKNNIKTSHIPIILLTAQTSSEQIISGMEAMVDMYITKPFILQNLIASIKALINNREALKSHFISDIAFTTGKGALSQIDRKFLNDFSGIVEGNLGNEKFCIEDICMSIGISRMHLYRKIKALTGMTVNEYIMERRLKKASYLLRHESLNIAQITYSVGFSSPSYFSTAFKAKYGYSPSEYKSRV